MHRNNQRNLHTKEDIPKFFGHIVTSAAKPNIIGSMTPYQIGTKPGHRAQEHLFVLKSVIGLFEHNRQAIALQLWDLSKYFDRESLVDGMNELYRSNVKGKLYKLLYEMNRNTRISVRTPVGDTEWRDVGEGWGQGTIEGAICSAANLDKGVHDFFSDSEYEVSYGDLVLSPALFQDDVSRLCLDPVSAQMGNAKMEAMAETKLLDFNTDKSCFIIIGKDKEQRKLEDVFAADKPLLYGSPMKQSKGEKYLGDQICSGGLAASVAATVDNRGGKVWRAIHEIRTVVDDCRSNVTGGLTAGLDIWEVAVLPYLMNNCESWIAVSDSTIEVLDNLQNHFYRTLLEVPLGTPIPALLWECGGMLMKNRIMKKKLMFLHHLATLEKTSLAYQVYEVQCRLNLPGLLEECQPYLVRFGIMRLEGYNKPQWKKMINSKMAEINKSELLEKMDKYKKLDKTKLGEEKFEVKSYLKSLTPSQARMKFRLNSFMTKTVKMNFPSNPKFVKSLWTCWHCDQIDTQSHIMHCDKYESFRLDKNLDNDQELVSYFKQVIKLRENLDK